MDTFPELVNSSVKFKIRFVKKRENYAEIGLDKI